MVVAPDGLTDGPAAGPGWLLMISDDFIGDRDRQTSGAVVVVVQGGEEKNGI